MFEFLVILFAHWFANYPIQAIGYEWMKNKHKDFKHLINHCLTYYVTILFIVFLFSWKNPFNINTNLIWFWALINCILHGCVDYWTSKATNKLWNKGVTVTPKEITKDYIQYNPFLQHNNIIPTIQYNQKYVGPFWCVVGFDQMLHMICLFVTAEMLGMI